MKPNKEPDKSTGLHREASDYLHHEARGSSHDSLTETTKSTLLMDTAQRVAKSTGEVLEEISASAQDQSLDLSNQVSLTANRVAKSTGEALEKVTMQETGSKSLNWSSELTATAQRVAHSIREEQEKVKVAVQNLETSGNNSLSRVKETAQRVAKSTKEALEQTSGVRPVEGPSVLKEAELIAQRVARSTGHARLRLEDREGTSPVHSRIEMPSGLRYSHIQREDPKASPFNASHSLSSLHNDNTSVQSNSKDQRKLPLLPSTPFQYESKQRVSSPLHTGYSSLDATTRTPAHINEARKGHRRKKADSLSSSSEYSTTESSELPPRHRSKSSLMVHRQSVINDPDLYQSPLQKMTHTAELVAASTGQAVATLTSSLLS